MSGVLLVEAGQAVGGALLGVAGPHVPVGDQLHAIGIDGRQQQDVVVQDTQRLGVAAAQQVVGLGEQRLRGNHFGGVQAAIDPHDRFALRGQRPRLVVGEAFGARQSLRDLLVARQVPEVGRRRDDGHDDRPAFSSLADFFQPDAVGFLGDLVPVVQQLSVVGQKVIVTRRVCAEHRRRNRPLGERRGRRQNRRRAQPCRGSHRFSIHDVHLSVFPGRMLAGTRTPVPYFSMVRVFMLYTSPGEST